MSSDPIGQVRVYELIRDAPPWYKVPSLVKLYLLLIPPLMVPAALGFDLSMSNGLQSVKIFMDNFGNPSGATLGFFGASGAVGGLIGCIVGSPLNDLLGRKLLVSIGAIIIIGMVFMQAWATNLWMFSGAKVGLGFGVALQQLSAPVLVTELAHPKQRETLTSMYNTSIFVGFICGAWVTFGTYRLDSQWSWRIPTLLQMVLPVYQAIFGWFCPESPRWLANKGRFEQARAILVKYHGNGVEDEIVHAELQEIMAGLEADKTVLRFNKEGIKTIFGTKGNLHRLWLGFFTALGSQCLGNNFVSAYLPLILEQVGIKSSRDKTLINAVISIWQWASAFTVATFFIGRIGRRPLFFYSTLASTVVFVVWTALTASYLKDPNPAYGIGLIVMIFLFSFFNAVCWGPLVITYPLEVVTTKQRGIFFAMTMFWINIFSFITSYINPIGLQSLSWRYYIVQCVFNVVALVVIWFTYVETHGLTLEEIAQIFDGKDQFEQANAAVSAALQSKTA